MRHEHVVRVMDRAVTIADTNMDRALRTNDATIVSRAVHATGYVVKTAKLVDAIRQEDA